MAWLEKRKGTWFICTRNENAKTVRVKASRDKQVAKARLGEFETKQMRGEDYGDKFKDHRDRPLVEHVEDYIADLTALGRDSMYVYTIEKRLMKVIASCGWKALRDITPDGFCAWRAQPIEQGQVEGERKQVGPRTLNQYLEALRSFSRWCRKMERMADNGIGAVEKVDCTSDVRRERRALSEDELVRLMKAVPAEYRRVYYFMLATGLRRAEVLDLRWGDVRLDSPTPFLKLRAKATKAKRADELPLRADVAVDLRKHRGPADDGDPVFLAVPDMDEHKSFLTAAGIAWKDSEGRRADVHALRHTYGTLLSKAGVSPREAMELMRHSDIKLTMKHYTDPRLFDLRRGVEKLALPAMDQQADAAAEAM